MMLTYWRTRYLRHLNLSVFSAQDEPATPDLQGGNQKNLQVTVLTIIAVLVVVLLLLEFAPHIGLLGSESCEYTEPPPDLDLPVIPQGLSNGEAAPLFNTTDIDGATVRMEDLQGRVVVMNFMGTWCMSCIWEAGRLAEIYNLYQDRGVEVLSISVEPDGSVSNIREFRSSYCADWQFILDNGTLMSLYNVESLPTTYIIDQSGNVAYGHVGIVDVSDVSSRVEQLLSG